MQDSLCPSRQAASVHREPRLFSCNRPGFIVTSTRPQPVPRAAVPLISLACSTGPPEPGTTLHSPRRSLPRGQADKDSLTRWTLGGRIHEEQPADPRPDLRLQKRAVNDYAISRSRYLAIPLSRTLAHFEPQRATGLGRPLQVQSLRPPAATQAEHSLHALPRLRQRLVPKSRPTPPREDRKQSQREPAQKITTCKKRPKQPTLPPQWTTPSPQTRPPSGRGLTTSRPFTPSNAASRKTQPSRQAP